MKASHAASKNKPLPTKKVQPNAAKSFSAATKPSKNNNHKESVFTKYFDYSGESKNLKKAFFISLICMLGIFLVSGYNIGFGSDEMDMNAYGKANIDYYLSGGKDTTFLHPSLHNALKMDATLPYYGSDFEYIASGFNRITGLDKGREEFNSRHAMNQIFAVLAIMFAGLFAARLGGYKAALFTSWLMFLTPTFFGHSLMNTKDIPFATGYIASLYFTALFLEQMPKPNWKTSLAMVAAMAFTIGTRVGGVLVYFYLFLFIALWYFMNKSHREAIGKKEIIQPLFLKIVAIVGGSLLITVLAWPFVLQHPFENFIAAMNVAKKFPTRIKLTFEGDVLFSTNLPFNYLLKHLSITIPLFIIACLIVSTVFLTLNYRKIKWPLALLVLFASVFPLVYAIKTHMSVYCGWRHFLFIYPGLMVITGTGLSYITNMLKKPAMQFAFVGVCLLCLAHPIIWSIKNHPFEYVYYNETVGGFKGAFYNYETDYWEISEKNAVDWLFKHEPIMQSKDSVYIGTNAYSFVDYYIKRNYPKAKVRAIPSGERNRPYLQWNYFLLNTLFLDPDYMENFYPPEGTIHSITVDKMPVTAIIKDTVRYDFKAYRALIDDKYRTADSFLTLYDKMYKKEDPATYGLTAVISVFNNQFQKAHDYGVKAVQFDDANLYGHIALGIYYMHQSNAHAAYASLSTALAIQPNNQYVQGLLKVVKAALGVKQ